MINLAPSNNYEVRIDLSDLHSGIYMIRIKGDETEEIHKLLKQ